MLEIINVIESDREREFIKSFYLSYYRLLCEKAYSILENADETEETVQETFVKLIENLDKLMGFTKEHVYAYAVATTRNIALNRKYKNEKIKFCVLNTEDESLEKWLADNSAIPEDIYNNKEMLHEIARFIDKLPKRDKAVLEYKYILEYDDEEIAKELKISKQSVRTYLTRARRKAYAAAVKEGVGV